ncbi:cyclic nucleotide-binding domain-containing protein [Devosia sp. ZB163]|uniref:cyclic nucleotide-binding domain-containing protein n=1 Tax=Devosia sp. ZB163 TaxID=3025938 RepID=UPI00235FA4D7|nr:cyclic nucleotide-binding domain-containing protein [Devosia sp. ZB163]MDC9824004.1 cyclic nucleotide-binding domain-containing protein [Devosia sp. ZB163]
MLSDLVSQLTDPGHLLTHLPYALLVLSMLMNDMGWLRAIAIAAGLIRIVNRAFIDIDPVIVFWESIFVGVNVVQLLVLWYYAKRHRFTDDEQRFAAIMPAGIDRRSIRRLLRLAQMRHADAGARLTLEGQSVNELLFLAEGVAQIEKGGRIIGVCGPGDFLGEMSFVSGAPASATAVASRPVRYLAFDQKKLRTAVDADADLRRAIDASLNSNLVGKLAKANAVGSA